MHNSENGNAAMEETGDVRYKPKGWRFSKDRCTRWFFELIYATTKKFGDFLEVSAGFQNHVQIYPMVKKSDYFPETAPHFDFFC